MRQTASHLFIWAFVTILLAALRINVGPFVNRGWVVPPQLSFIF